MAGKAGLCPSLRADNAMAKTGCVLHINPLLFCVCAPKICCVFAEETPQHLKKICLFYIKTTTKQGGRDEVAVIVLLQRAAGGDRETTFPSHAAY